MNCDREGKDVMRAILSTLAAWIIALALVGGWVGIHYVVEMMG